MPYTPQGNFIAGIKISDTVFLAVTTLNQIQSYGLNPPKEMQNLKKRQASAQEITNAATRKSVQRDFDKPRIDRAEEQANYIEGFLLKGKNGGMPCITLHHEKQLDTGEEHNENGFYFPYNTSIVAIDGETQTEGRFILRSRNSGTGTTPFGIMVYHGITRDAAQQILHDYNTYGTPVSEKQIILFNKEGQLTKGILAAIHLSGADKDKFNRKGSKANKNQYASHVQLTTAIMSFTFGTRSAIKKATAKEVKAANRANAIPMTKQAIDMLVDLIKSSVTDPDIGKMPLDLWHTAGYLISHGTPAKDLNWANAKKEVINVFNDKKMGIDITTTEALTRYSNAMK